ncbi:hypothetical protein BKA56DRAFT_612614 [Ilyonectria sp. MPI-CAGE-AT-0026]|nr:hypothetical protein BKA56DRAFT_612614 [Ilyonectria sp. MPI-CAGE-AT-0026]
MDIFGTMVPRRLLAMIKSTIRQSPGKVQSQDCIILQLPVEVLLLIVESLPLFNQIIVSQTCRPLRNILAHLRNSASYLPRDEFLEFLSCLARNMPRKWVCGVCLALHRVCLQDTRKNPYYSNCPRFCHQTPYRLESFYLYNRHVQLALKYTRMGNISKKYQRHLETLLTPYHGTFSADAFKETTLQRRHSVYPKIVNGRYLVLSVWRYDMDREKVSRERMDSLWVCGHQILNDWDDALREMAGYRVQDNPKKVLWTAVSTAFQAEGAEVHKSCPYCLTDFSVQACPERATVRMWQDLGPEGSPLNTEWTENNISISIWEELGFKILSNKVPGDIRRLYELG